MLATAGLLFYIAWLGGTIFGSLIKSLSEFTEVSSAALPVLFVALASAMARSRGTCSLRSPPPHWSMGRAALNHSPC